MSSEVNPKVISNLSYPASTIFCVFNEALARIIDLELSGEQLSLPQYNSPTIIRDVGIMNIMFTIRNLGSGEKLSEIEITTDSGETKIIKGTFYSQQVDFELKIKVPNSDALSFKFDKACTVVMKETGICKTGNSAYRYSPVKWGPTEEFIKFLETRLFGKIFDALANIECKEGNCPHGHAF